MPKNKKDPVKWGSKAYREAYKSGTITSYNKKKNLHVGKNLATATATDKAPGWLKAQREYEKKYPKPELPTEGPNKALNTKSGKQIEWEENRKKYIAKSIEKQYPKLKNSKLSRGERLNQLTDKEQELLLDGAAKYNTSYWQEAKRGIQATGEALIGDSLPTKINKDAYSKKELKEKVMSSVKSPKSNKLGEMAGILSPLTIPAKAVQSIYKGNYSIKDAIKGTKNDAGIVEDVLTDPLNLAGAGFLDKIGKAGKLAKTVKSIDKLTDVAKIADNAPNKNVFKSELNWEKWLKDNNPVADATDVTAIKSHVKEYDVIEQAAKENGTWMKNSNGSAFKGTKEQFVQQLSGDFKKSMPNVLKTDEGTTIPLYHSNDAPKNEFTYFDQDRSGDKGTYYGRGQYTTADLKHSRKYGPNTTELYGNVDRNKSIVKEEAVAWGRSPDVHLANNFGKKKLDKPKLDFDLDMPAYASMPDNPKTSSVEDWYKAQRSDNPTDFVPNEKRVKFEAKLDPMIDTYSKMHAGFNKLESSGKYIDKMYADPVKAAKNVDQKEYLRLLDESKSFEKLLSRNIKPEELKYFRDEGRGVSGYDTAAISKDLNIDPLYSNSRPQTLDNYKLLFDQSDMKNNFSQYTKDRRHTLDNHFANKFIDLKKANNEYINESVKYNLAKKNEVKFPGQDNVMVTTKDGEFTKNNPLEVILPYDNPMKSTVGNNGNFDMSNTSFYKSIVPPAVAGLGSTLLNQPNEVEEFKNGGYLNSSNSVQNTLQQRQALNNLPSYNSPQKFKDGGSLTDPGQRLIPNQITPDKFAPKVNYDSYTVKAGDILGGIGKQYGVNYLDIAKENKLSDPSKISIGQVLKIPVKRKQNINKTGTTPNGYSTNWGKPKMKMDSEGNFQNEIKNKAKPISNTLYNNPNKISDEEIIKNYNIKNKKQGNYVIVDKKTNQMKVYNNGKIVDTFSVGLGTKSGQDKVTGSHGQKGFTGAGIYKIGDSKRVEEHLTNSPSKIKKLQKQMKDAGHQISADGKWGPNSKKAYLDYAKENKLEAEPDFKSKGKEDYYDRLYDKNFLGLEGENGLLQGMAIHQIPSGNSSRKNKLSDNNKDNDDFSWGCINCNKEEHKKFQTYVKSGTEVYVLPEEEGNRFYDDDYNLKFITDDRSKYKSGNYNYSGKSKGAVGKVSYSTNNTNSNKDKFLNTLTSNRENLISDLGISSREYDELVKKSYGIAQAETEFGDRKILRKPSHSMYAEELVADVAEFFGNESYGKNISRGLTQIRYKNIDPELAKKYDITPDNLMDPEKSALATMIYLSKEALPEVYRNVGRLNATRDNIYDYLPYAMNQRQKLNLGYDPGTKKELDPYSNSYAKKIKNAESDIQISTEFKNGGQLNNMKKKYNAGGMMQAAAPFVGMIPGIGMLAAPAMSLAGGLLSQNQANNEFKTNQTKTNRKNFSQQSMHNEANNYGFMEDGGQLTHFNGPKHEQGGIQIPSMGAEVEGGETMNQDNNYVNSDHLGYDKDGYPTMNPNAVKTTFADASKKIENKYRKKTSFEEHAGEKISQAMINSDNEKVRPQQPQMPSQQQQMPSQMPPQMGQQGMEQGMAPGMENMPQGNQEMPQFNLGGQIGWPPNNSKGLSSMPSNYSGNFNPWENQSIGQAPTSIKNNQGSSTPVKKSPSQYTMGDKMNLMGAGIGIAAQIPALMGNAESTQMRSYNPMINRTKYNATPELQQLEGNRQSYNQNVRNSTSNSGTANARMLAGLSNSNQSSSNVLRNKQQQDNQRNNQANQTINQGRQYSAREAARVDEVNAQNKAGHLNSQQQSTLNIGQQMAGTGQYFNELAGQQTQFALLQDMYSNYGMSGENFADFLKRMKQGESAVGYKKQQ